MALLFSNLAAVAGEAFNFIKKETLVQLLSCEFCEISKNTFFQRTHPVAATANSPRFSRLTQHNVLPVGNIEEKEEKDASEAVVRRCSSK